MTSKIALEKLNAIRSRPRVVGWDSSARPAIIKVLVDYFAPHRPSEVLETDVLLDIASWAVSASALAKHAGQMDAAVDMIDEA